MVRICHFIFFLILAQVTAAQSVTWYKGQIVDEENGAPVAYAQLASYSTYTIYAADSLGLFHIALPANDSMRVLALGYEPITINAGYTHYFPTGKIALKRMPIMLTQVDIYKQSANSHLQGFMPKGITLGYQNPEPIGLRSDVGGKPPLLAAVFNPASFAYYHLSRREKRKREAKKILATEIQQDRLSKTLVGEITGLSAQELTDFFVYCNIHLKIKRSHPDSYIRSQIIDLFTQYQKKQVKK